MTTKSLQAELPLGAKRRQPIPLDVPILIAKPTYLAALKYGVISRPKA